MIDPGLIAFGIGYLGLAVTVARGRGPVAAIGVMIIAYTLYTLAIPGLHAFISSLENLTLWINIRVFIYIFLSLFLAGVLKETGYLDLMVKGASSAGCRFSYTSVPALIGLLPMPGGALVSAIAMRKKYLEESKMPPEWASYLNYWFRHIWIPSWPLFQSVVITAAVLAITPVGVVSVTWPATPAAVAAGLAIGYPALSRYRCGMEPDGSRSLLLKASWPFILLAALIISGVASLLEALTLTLTATIIILRPGTTQLKNALLLAARPRIHAILFEALLLKELLLNTGTPQALYEAAASTGLPPLFIAFIVPFILGLAAGGENFFAATAMPLLKAYIITGGTIDPGMLLIAYTGGSMGVMASPVHLCYALTVDYYKARPGRVMLLSLASVVLTSFLVLLAYFTLLA